MRRSNALFGLAAASLACVLWFWRQPTVDPPGLEGLAPPVAHAPSREFAEADRVDPYSRRAVASSLKQAHITSLTDPNKLAHGSITGREFLAEYWGENWPEVLAAMQEAGVDPELFEPSEWLSYDEARPAVEEMASRMLAGDLEDLEKRFLRESANLRRQEFQYTAVNPEQKQLSEDNIEFLRKIIVQYDADLRDLASRWGVALEHAFANTLADGVTVESHPFFFPAFTKHSGDVVSYRISASGWCVQISISSNDYPEFAELTLLAENIYAARNQELAAHIALM